MYSHNDKIDARSKETVLTSITEKPEKSRNTRNTHTPSIHILRYTYIIIFRERERGELEKERFRKRGF